MLSHILVVALSVLHIVRSATTARKLVTIAKYAEGSLHDAVTPIPINSQHTTDQPMSYNSYNDVQTNTSHSTLMNANSARLRSPLQDSGYLPKVTKSITQLQTPYPHIPKAFQQDGFAFFFWVSQSAVIQH